MRSFSRQIKAPAQDQDGIDLGFVEKGVRKIEPHVNDLIAVVKGTRVVRRKKREGAVKSAERQERREQQIRQAMEECGAREDLSPEWLAQHVGLPIEYARWYLGSRKLWSSFGARLG